MASPLLRLIHTIILMHKSGCMFFSCSWTCGGSPWPAGQVASLVKGRVKSSRAGCSDGNSSDNTAPR